MHMWGSFEGKGKVEMIYVTTIGKYDVFEHRMRSSITICIPLSDFSYASTNPHVTLGHVHKSSVVKKELSIVQTKKLTINYTFLLYE